MLCAVVSQPLAGLQQQRRQRAAAVGGGLGTGVWAAVQRSKVQMLLAEPCRPTCVAVAAARRPSQLFHSPTRSTHPPTHTTHLQQAQQLRLAGQQLAQVLADERQAGKQVLQLLRLPIQACKEAQQVYYGTQEALWVLAQPLSYALPSAPSHSLQAFRHSSAPSLAQENASDI